MPDKFVSATLLEVKFHDEYEYEYEWKKEIKLCKHLESQNVCKKTIFKGLFYQKVTAKSLQGNHIKIFHSFSVTCVFVLVFIRIRLSPSVRSGFDRTGVNPNK